MDYNIRYMHISEIRAGHTVMHEGEMKTVSENDIHHDACMGWTLFGDSYRIGYKPVHVVIFKSAKIPA